MTQTMLHVDRVRTRMPLECTVIAVLVWTVFAAICVGSWLLATNDSAHDLQGLQGTKMEHAPQSNTSATNVSASKPADPYEMESRGRPGRRF